MYVFFFYRPQLRLVECRPGNVALPLLGLSLLLYGSTLKGSTLLLGSACKLLAWTGRAFSSVASYLLQLPGSCALLTHRCPPACVRYPPSIIEDLTAVQVLSRRRHAILAHYGWEAGGILLCIIAVAKAEPVVRHMAAYLECVTGGHTEAWTPAYWSASAREAWAATYPEDSGCMPPVWPAGGAGGYSGLSAAAKAEAIFNTAQRMFVYAVIRASELKENITVHDYAFAGGWPTYFSSTWGMRLIYKDGVGARGAAVTIPHSEKGFIYSLAKYTEEYGKATPTSARSIFECMVACGSPPLPHPAASGVGPATSKKRKREVRVWNCDAWGRVWKCARLPRVTLACALALFSGGACGSFDAQRGVRPAAGCGEVGLRLLSQMRRDGRWGALQGAVGRAHRDLPLDRDAELRAGALRERRVPRGRPRPDGQSLRRGLPRQGPAPGGDL
jgi:hypothetical protein